MSDPFNASKNYLDNYREDDGYFENNGNGKKDDGSAFHEGEAMVKGTMDMVDANGFEQYTDGGEEDVAKSDAMGVEDL